MEEKKFGSRIVSLLSGFLYIVFGILMISNPNTTLATLSLLMGWAVLISGVGAIVHSFRFRNVPTISSASLTEGLLLLILGLMFLFGNFIDSTRILAYLLIFWIIINSATQLQFAAFIRNTALRTIMIVMDVAILGYGIFMLFNPQSAEYFLVFYLGFGFVSSGVTKALKAFSL